MHINISGVDCGPIPSILNAYSHLESDTRYNATVTYYCVEGMWFNKKLSVKLRCEASGMWGGNMDNIYCNGW